MLCSHVHLVKSDRDYDLLRPLPCRSWSCERCAPARRRQLIQLAALGTPNKCLTLTINAKIGDSPSDRCRILHHSWTILVKRIKRLLKIKQLPYFAFLEKTRAGEAHLHILLRCKFIPQRWISQQMDELCQSPIVWIEAIKSTKKAIAYVTKYVGKAPERFDSGKRYYRSQSYLANVETDDEYLNDKPTYDRVCRNKWQNEWHDRIQAGQAVKVRPDGWYEFWRSGWERLPTGSYIYIGGFADV